MFGRKQRRLLERQNALLREALGWYATSANWRKRGTNPKGAPRTWQKSPAAFDRGARAKLAVTQADGATPDPSLFERLVDRFIGNAAGEPSES